MIRYMPLEAIRTVKIYYTNFMTHMMIHIAWINKTTCLTTFYT